MRKCIRYKYKKKYKMKILDEIKKQVEQEMLKIKKTNPPRPH